MNIECQNAEEGKIAGTAANEKVSKVGTVQQGKVARKASIGKPTNPHDSVIARYSSLFNPASAVSGDIGAFCEASREVSCS
jgi:hypothetical protein